MPNRPPKEWMERCIAGVKESGSAAVPGAVCGSLWYHKKTPAERTATAHAYGDLVRKKRFDLKAYQHELTELDLYLDNDRFMHVRKKSFIDSVKRKIAAKRYDARLAAGLWQYWVDEGARRYAKEFHVDIRKMFPLALREHLAKIVAKHEHGRITRGEYD